MLTLDTPKSWMPGKGTSVATWQLAEIIEEELPKLQAGLSNENRWTAGKDQNGAIQILAERAAMHYPKATAQSLCRRINAIRKREQRTTNLDLADALLMAFGMTIYESDLLVFPSCLKDAEEMCGIHAEMHGGPKYKSSTTSAAATRLRGIDKQAQSLVNFTKGFIYFDADILELAEDEEALAA